MTERKERKIADKLMDEILAATDSMARFKLIEQLNLFFRTLETRANTNYILSSQKK